jgi:hypothetical protein
MSPSTGHEDATGGAPVSPSRRSVLRGAAGVGAVGFAAAAGVGALAAPALAADNHRTAKAEVPLTARPADAAGAPLVIYLRDGGSGELDVFSGTSHAVVRDPALVARLTAAVRPSLAAQKRG